MGEVAAMAAFTECRIVAYHLHGKVFANL